MNRRWVVFQVCWLLAAMGPVQAQDFPVHPPSFWDQGMVIGVGRATWIYYHVTRLPQSCVLYCPNFPERPEEYVDWPKKRLVRPELMNNQGRWLMRDPEVERKQVEQRMAQAQSAEGLWARFFRWFTECCQSIWPRKKTWGARSFLFKPRIDEQFLGSTLFRYLPPDQFWQICRSELILVPQGESAEVIQKAILQGQQDHKLVLMLGPTSYPQTDHTRDFWQPWSVFRQTSSVVPVGKEALAGARDFQQMKQLEERPAVEPDQAGQQIHRKWRLIRQTDLATQCSIEALVDAEGEMSVPWPVGPVGSRFEIWVMNWGTVRANLVSCWTIFGRGQSGLHPWSVVKLSSTGEPMVVTGERYRLSWNMGNGPSGEWGLQSWNEDPSGELLDEAQFSHESGVGSRLIQSKNLGGSEVYALWWRSRSGDPWVLLSQERQLIQPLPRVELAWTDLEKVPRDQSVEMSGRFFPLQSLARIMVQQSGHESLIREFVGKSAWDCSFSPREEGLKPGRALLRVEYPAPWSSSSERPETWQVLKALDVGIRIVE